MRNDDPMADNLLWRLFSYSPRSGRNPLEDYCTEALVWCLRKSAVFRRNFLALIKLPEVETYTGDFEFHTQSSYSQKFYAEEDEDDETASWDRGRFDVLILPKDFSFVIVIEVKVEADFHFDQLKDYRRELDNGVRFKRIPKNCRRIVTLTKTPKKPQLADGNIQWSEVQKLLATMEIDGGSIAVDSIIKSFAEFLKEKGMRHVKIENLSPQLMNNWSACFKFQNELWDILDEVRKDDGIKSFIRKGGKIVVDRANTEVLFWLGIYGNTQAPCWFGFEFCEENGSPKLKMRVEGRAKSGMELKRASMTLNRAKHDEEVQDSGTAWHIFRQTVEPDYNGDDEKMFEWFQLAIHEFADWAKNSEEP